MLRGVSKCLIFIFFLGIFVAFLGQSEVQSKTIVRYDINLSCADNAVAPLNSIKDIQTFLNCNGFNPYFIGWGYEDNETLTRYNRMGYTVCRLNTDFKPLFHLDHENAEREQNPFYKINNNICNLVEKIDSKHLFLYSNTWKM